MIAFLGKDAEIAGDVFDGSGIFFVCPYSGTVLNWLREKEYQAADQYIGSSVESKGKLNAASVRTALTVLSCDGILFFSSINC